MSYANPNGSNKFIKIGYYHAGVLPKEYRDTDGNGLLDLLVAYDLFGNETLREPINPQIESSHAK
jgi:hypothetical protein